MLLDENVDTKLPQLAAKLTEIAKEVKTVNIAVRNEDMSKFNN